MPLELLLKKPISDYTERDKKALLNDHRFMHARHVITEDPVAKEKIEEQHAAVVRKLLGLKVDHNIVDALDESLPGELKERSRKHEGLKLSPNEDLESKNDKTLRMYHYMVHRLFRLYNKEGWDGFQTQEDWVNFHIRLMDVMKARGMSHIDQDELDNLSEGLVSTEKSHQPTAREE